MKVVVFDLDGTLCNIEHRRGYVATKPKNWAAFNAGIPNDTPHEDIVSLVDLFADKDYTIILCSGRGEENRLVTEQWLEDYDIPYRKLFMRPANDHRPDYVIKIELLGQIRAGYGNPWLWFDDRDSVVESIRAQGVRVLQVCEGNF
jgi:hypothetical protein